MTQALKSPLAWLGGKSRLADRIIEVMPDHQTYCEVFAGAAWVLFKKPESKVEIINDINSDLTNLYRCVKHHLGELVLQFRWMLVARDEFERLLATPTETLTDIQRAARFYYLAKSSFGARIVKPTFGIAATAPSRLNLTRIEEDLSEAHLRLSRVYIENRPFDQVILRFDKAGTLFYLDPPYWNSEKEYGENIFSREDFGRLAEILDGVKGKFILSLNDTAGVRETFANFQIAAVKTRYSFSNYAKKEVGEVLISNFPMAGSQSSRLNRVPKLATRSAKASAN
ncbi:DNA adenine methylase [Diaphorobacter sp. HDW4A]|nr:DNA adenine methylase [Diaphorobacter sp. HDW4A]